MSFVVLAMLGLSSGYLEGRYHAVSPLMRSFGARLLGPAPLSAWRLSPIRAAHETVLGGVISLDFV